LGVHFKNKGGCAVRRHMYYMQRLYIVFHKKFLFGFGLGFGFGTFGRSVASLFA